MNINHHPSDELLLDYATGAMGEAWSLAIATHLSLCPACRKMVSRMEQVGGNMLGDSSPEPIGPDALEKVMARLDQIEQKSQEHVPGPFDVASEPVLPQPLRRYAGGDLDSIAWQRLGLGAHQLLIPTNDDDATARLLRIPAGRPVPEHTHGGLELTLVLSGAFSDITGEYRRGDLQEADDSLEHQPHAAPGAECICLAVTDSPLRFKSFAARLVQPFLDL